jgi:ABC-type uncharacterized transport system substrate-binding protein
VGRRQGSDSDHPDRLPTGLDPVRTGIVKSLSRPEANLTGATFYSGVLMAKQLEMLRELVPKAARVAMLVHPSSPSAAVQMTDAAAAARGNGLALDIVKVIDVDGLEEAFASVVRRKDDALLLAVDPFFDSRPERMIELSAGQKVPTIYYLREFVASGGLMCYGGSNRET